MRALVMVLLLSSCAAAKPAVAPTLGAAEYTAEMEKCLDRGKLAKSRAVYRICADEVDARYQGTP